MPALKRDQSNPPVPVPQYLRDDGTAYEDLKGTNGASYVTIKDTTGDALNVLPDGTMPINSFVQRWRDQFTDGVLNASKWDVIQQGAGQTIAVSNGTLTIGAGTNNGDTTILRSKAIFSIPCRLLVGLNSISQIPSNQEFDIGFVACDAQGNYTGTDGAQMRINNTCTNSQLIYDVWTGNDTVLSSAPSTCTNYTTTPQNLELEASPDEVYFYYKAMDSNAQRSGNYVRQQQVPDPALYYKLQIKVSNTGVPVGNTTMVLAYVNVLQHTEAAVELIASRGVSSGGQAMATYNTNNISSVTAQLQQYTSWYTDTTTNLGSGATYTGSGRSMGSSTYFYDTTFRVMVNHVAGTVPGELVIEQSPDNSAWKETHRVPIPSVASVFHVFDFPALMYYIRLRFVNGGTAQTAMGIYSTKIAVETPTLFPALDFLHSTTNLGSAATFTGTALDLGAANRMYFIHRSGVFADQTGTLYLEQSKDGATWRTTQTQAVTVNTQAYIEDKIYMRYVRVRYVNGASAQGTFELQSSLIPVGGV